MHATSQGESRRCSIPSLEAEDRAWLERLSPRFGGPIRGPSIASVAVRARSLASAIERLDIGDAASAARRERASQLDRQADVLEHVDALYARACQDQAPLLAQAARADPLTVIHAPVLAAMLDEGMATPTAGEIDDAIAWLVELPPLVLRLLSALVTAERRVRELGALRSRAYHYLEAALPHAVPWSDRPAWIR